MSERLVSENLRPSSDAGFLGTPRVGEPGLPRQFRWGKRDLVLRELLDQWKSVGPCSHGSGERYLRRHWFRVRAEDGSILTIYFERQPKAGAKRRWWLYTVMETTKEDP